MRLLIIFGAGASADCYTEYSGQSTRMPLANELFANEETQNKLLKKYRLMDLASKLRRELKEQQELFDIRPVA